MRQKKKKKRVTESAKTRANKDVAPRKTEAKLLAGNRTRERTAPRWKTSAGDKPVCGKRRATGRWEERGGGKKSTGGRGIREKKGTTGDVIVTSM